MRKSLCSTTTFLTRLRVFTLFGLAILIGLAAFHVQVQAATLTVTKTADTNDGVCDADCSLREAIGAALPGDTVIVPAGTYTLTLGTELTIDTDLTLIGAGKGVTIIQAATQPGVVDYGVFEVSGGTIATISGVTIRHGNTFLGGSGIHNDGALTVTNSTISNNSAGLRGGGITNFPTGTLRVKNSTISDNSADIGGGIWNFGTLSVTNSTISLNSAASNGGGIHNDGTLTVTNSGISSNSAVGSGGGISNSSIMTVKNSTIFNNSAVGSGGGISDSSNRTVLINTIIAGNVPGGDCSGGVLSLGVNLDSDDTCNLSPVFDLPGTDPLLGPLQDNGGPTETHALLPGSPAIGVGEPCSLATDQRGVLREQGVGCDIGAFEVGPVPRCNLDLRLEYDGSNLSLGFDLATQDPALWDVRLVSIFGLTNLWSAPVPVVDPPVFLPVEFPFPNIGNIGIVTTLTTAEGGIPCADVEIVDTGGLGPSREELENLVEQSGVFGDGGGR